MLFWLAILMRYQWVSRVSGIVLAGLSGAAFAFVENILYYGRAYRYASRTFGEVPPLEALQSLFMLRGVMTFFGHPLFTAMTGIGLAVGTPLQEQGRPGGGAAGRLHRRGFPAHGLQRLGVAAAGHQPAAHLPAGRPAPRHRGHRLHRPAGPARRTADPHPAGRLRTARLAVRGRPGPVVPAPDPRQGALARRSSPAPTSCWPRSGCSARSPSSPTCATP